MRIGHGYDSNIFEKNRKLILAGIKPRPFIYIFSIS